MNYFYTAGSDAKNCMLDEIFYCGLRGDVVEIKNKRCKLLVVELGRVNELVIENVKTERLILQAVLCNSIRISKSSISEDLIIDYLQVKQNIFIEDTEVGSILEIRNSNVKGDMVIEDAGFVLNSLILLSDNIIEGSINVRGPGAFKSLSINSNEVSDILVERVNFSEDVAICDCIIKGTLELNNVKIKGELNLSNTAIEKALEFDEADVSRIRYEYFATPSPKVEESLYRKLRLICERFGKRGEADEYFVLEMDAKRRQKQAIVAFLERLFMFFFSYGVSIKRVLFTWSIMVFLFSLLYYLGSGVLNACDFF